MCPMEVISIHVDGPEHTKIMKYELRPILQKVEDAGHIFIFSEKYHLIAAICYTLYTIGMYLFLCGQ